MSHRSLTFVAAEIAKALTGEAQQTDEGRYRMVHLHPSYAHEDFVQGLRPDLERTGLHYCIRYAAQPLAPNAPAALRAVRTHFRSTWQHRPCV
ncbi:hypothetical protein [Sorangium sp. So ce887]|uniref:hypothetical protein n=1 Tax=Sorangium sp. So ce887 TaxID=3133324 RepID=UPI003F617907